MRHRDCAAILWVMERECAKRVRPLAAAPYAFKGQDSWGRIAAAFVGTAKRTPVAVVVECGLRSTMRGCCDC